MSEQLSFSFFPPHLVYTLGGPSVGLGLCLDPLTQITRQEVRERPDMFTPKKRLGTWAH